MRILEEKNGHNDKSHNKTKQNKKKKRKESNERESERERERESDKMLGIQEGKEVSPPSSRWKRLRSSTPTQFLTLLFSSLFVSLKKK